MEDAVNNVANSVTHGYLDNGAIGLVAVTFLVLFLASTFRDYKKDQSLTKITGSLDVMAENQSKLTLMYQNALSRHDQVVGLLTSVLQTERQNTKDCYKDMVSNQDIMDRKLDEIKTLVNSNA